eukprot:7860445-Alexandrium_andersonii.AAC.1
MSNWPSLQQARGPTVQRTPPCNLQQNRRTRRARPRPGPADALRGHCPSAGPRGRHRGPEHGPGRLGA